MRVAPATRSSDLRQLEELYASQYTGAVTTRTATLNGFAEDLCVHTVWGWFLFALRTQAIIIHVLLVVGGLHSRLLQLHQLIWLLASSAERLHYGCCINHLKESAQEQADHHQCHIE